MSLLPIATIVIGGGWPGWGLLATLETRLADVIAISPLLLTAAGLLVAGAIGVLATRRLLRGREDAPLARLTAPLGLMVGTIILGSVISIWVTHRAFNRELARTSVEETKRHLPVVLGRQEDRLFSALQTIAGAPTFLEALEGQQVEVLRADWQSVYDAMAQARAIDDFVVYGPEGNCLLHFGPERRAAVARDNPVLAEAVEAGLPAQGIGRDSSGSFAFKAVQPILTISGVAGYVEMTKGLGEALRAFHRHPAVELAIILRPAHPPDRGQTRSGTDSGADLQERLAYFSGGELTPELVSVMGSVGDSGVVPGDAVARESWQDAQGHWLYGTAPLRGIDGRVFAHLLVMRDFSSEVASQHRSLVILVLAATVSLGMLLGFFRMVMRRADRVLSEQRLSARIASERFKALFEHSISGIAVHEILFGPDGQALDYQYIDANPAFEEHSGLSVSKVRGRRVTEILPEEALPPFIETYGEVVRSQTAISFQTYFEPLGRHFMIHAYPIGERFFATTFEDITASVQAEEALRESQERFRTLFEQSPVSILLLDPEDASVVDANRVACAFYGCSTVAELASKEIWTDPPYSRRDAVAWIARAKAEGPQSFEWCSFLPGGEPKWEQTQLSIVTIAGMKRAIAAGFEITNLKRVQHELRESNLRLSEATARAVILAEAAQAASLAKTQFLTNMSHEVRTPLNGIMGMVELLLESPLDAAQREYVETLQLSGLDMIRIVDDLLDISRIEAGKVQLESISFHPRVLVEEAVAPFLPQARRKHLQISTEVEAEVPATLQGDPTRLRQILTNLISNGIKFTERGRVTVRLTQDGVGPAGWRLRFAVRDTGIGIPEQKFPLLFLKFSQLDSSTTRRFGGTGLGLAIVKELVSLMKGQVGCESSGHPGEGSEFWFTVELPEACTDTQAALGLHGRETEAG